MKVNKSGYVYMVRSGRAVRIGFTLCHNLEGRMKSTFSSMKEYGTPELVGYVAGTMTDQERALTLGRRIRGAATELFHLGSIPLLGEIFPGRQLFTELLGKQEPSAGMTDSQITELLALGREAIQWAKDVTTELISADALSDRRMLATGKAKL